ncbi:hypothetical protein RJ639_014635 [Escallonia herrerae]|uniref:Serine aminopeptidase S33 domain-containing protein n=1 Tax=Escallonia herrerae TaxID=1293975 RepID=A0AA88VIR0_9ASTE|nr:hypothetical protein RJ639_014635 [Escallonia herrerae]
MQLRVSGNYEGLNLLLNHVARRCYKRCDLIDSFHGQAFSGGTWRVEAPGRSETKFESVALISVLSFLIFLSDFVESISTLDYRADYNPDLYLWEKDFTLAGRQYNRQDLEASTDICYQKIYRLRNARGHTLRCSHYVPSPFPDNTPLPCVIYCHGNSGCRADANEAAVILLPSNITVFTLDFSGSGLSDGNYVSLGWHEKDDLKVVVSYLRSNEQISCIGLWGRSMGAMTSLLYGAEDPSIAGMVLDSAFSNLFDLMMELVDVYKIRLPKFTVNIGYECGINASAMHLPQLESKVKVAVQYMRRIIQKKAKFDIMELNCMQVWHLYLTVAPKTFIPSLFGHAKDDKFIQPHHSDLIFNSYAGDKNIIKFDGDHNSSRPQFYYDSVSIFFYNILHPPPASSAYSSKVEKYYDLGDLKVGSDMDESLLYEIIAGLRSAGTGAASSSSAPASVSAMKSIGAFLSDIGPSTSVILAIFSFSFSHPFYFQLKNQVIRVRNAAHTRAQIERVGEDAHLWAALRNLQQIAPPTTIRSKKISLHMLDFFCVILFSIGGFVNHFGEIVEFFELL